MSLRAFRRPRIVIGALYVVAGTLLGGCITVVTDHDARPYRFSDSTAFKFKVVSAAMPRPRIVWRDIPRPAETLLTLTPDLPGCKQVSFYAADESNRVRRIAARTFLVPVVGPADPDDGAGPWQRLPDDPCAILIAAVARLGDGDRTCALTFSTRSGVVRTLDFQIPREPRNPGAVRNVLGGALEVLTLTAFDIALSPVVAPLMLGVLFFGGPGDVGPVMVNFTFPDGSVRETTLASAEITELQCLDPFQFESAFLPKARPDSTVRCWARAAVLKLGFDYREEYVERPNARPIDRYRDPFFAMIDGHPGAWSYRLEGRRDTYASLMSRLGRARSIYFSMSAAAGAP